MQSLLIPAQESCFLLRILNVSSQSLESLKEHVSFYLNHFISFKSSLDLVDSRSVRSHRNENSEEPRGAVFNALDAMLKESLDRLKIMREGIGYGHVVNSDAAKYMTDAASMIRMLCWDGKLGTSLWLWKTVVEQRRTPDVITHNHLVSLLCKKGYLVKAECLVKEMWIHGPYPTCATYNTLMKGYCLVNKVDKALDVFSSMQYNLGIRPNVISCNILVHALCQKGLLEDTRRLLDKILGENRNLITSTILMDGYFKTGKIGRALACWDDLFRRGVNVDAVAYNVIIHGHCLSGSMRHVYKSLSGMFKSGYLLDIFTFNTLMSRLCKSGWANEACYIFSVMSRMGVCPDEITYKIIIQGLCVGGDVVRAHRYLSLMLENSFVPEAFVWNVVIDGYMKCGQLQNAFLVRNQMAEFQIMPNVYTYNALINGILSVKMDGNIDGAHYLKREMMSMGVFPDSVTYNLLIGADCDLGDIDSALRLYDEMVRRGCKPDIITYTELLKCYCMRNKMKEAEELFYKMRMSDLHIDHVPFMILMKKCFRIGELDKMFEIYLMWLMQGGKYI